MQDVLESSREVVSRRRNGVVARQLVILNPASLQDGKKHWDARENAFAVALDEVRSRGPDSNDEVGRFVAIKRVEIIHEWAVGFVAANPAFRSE